MKNTSFFILVLVCILIFSACSVPSSGAEPTPDITPETSPASDITPEASMTVEPTQQAATPQPTQFGETPDQAGVGGVKFDIYQREALVDLDGNGQPEQITFSAGDASSTLRINGTEFTIDNEGLAQLFAVTDVDSADNILELAFTEKYSDLADSEKAYTWLYWWDGTQGYPHGRAYGCEIRRRLERQFRSGPAF